MEKRPEQNQVFRDGAIASNVDKLTETDNEHRIGSARVPVDHQHRYNAQQDVNEPPVELCLVQVVPVTKVTSQKLDDHL